jgi:hypothetical protein
MLSVVFVTIVVKKLGLSLNVFDFVYFLNELKLPSPSEEVQGVRFSKKILSF